LSSDFTVLLNRDEVGKEDSLDALLIKPYHSEIHHLHLKVDYEKARGKLLFDHEDDMNSGYISPWLCFMLKEKGSMRIVSSCGYNVNLVVGYR